MNDTLLNIQGAVKETLTASLERGEPVNPALAKIAMARGLNLDMVKRAVEAVNVVRFLRLDNEGRKGDYPLADAIEVARLMQGTEKAASYIPPDSLLIYEADETDYLKQYGHRLQKSAHPDDLFAVDAVVDPGMQSVDDLVHQAGKLSTRLQKLGEAAHQKAEEYSATAAKTLRKVAQAFSSPTGPSFREFEGEMLALFVQEPEVVRPVLDAVAKHAAYVDGRAKGPADLLAVVVETPQITSCRAVVSQLAKSAHARVLAGQFQKQAEKHQRQLLSKFRPEPMQAMDTTESFFQELIKEADNPPAIPTPQTPSATPRPGLRQRLNEQITMNKPIEEYAAKHLKFLGGAASLAGKTMVAPFSNLSPSSTFLPGLRDSLLQKAMDKSVTQKPQAIDSKFQKAINSIKRQAILTHLVKEDEVLRHADPQKIAAMYNMMVEVSPTLSMQPEIARSFLRSSVDQMSVDQLTVESLLKTEKRMKELSGALPMVAEKD